MSTTNYAAHVAIATTARKRDEDNCPYRKRYERAKKVQRGESDEGTSYWSGSFVE